MSDLALRLICVLFAAVLVAIAASSLDGDAAVEAAAPHAAAVQHQAR
ncbi:MAG: hypothetical protein LBI92_09775 [Azoarcus sp.]|nr:hypothetical protein [Azoarcus sp.]